MPTFGVISHVFARKKMLDDIARRKKWRIPAVIPIWHEPCKAWDNRRNGRKDQPGFREAKMVTMGKMKQAAMAAFGAFVLTTVAVGAAVGPARAVETTPVSLVSAEVSGQALA